MSTCDVHESALIGEGTRIGPYSVIHKNARIGIHCTIGSGAVIHADTVIGDNVKPYGTDLNRNYGFKWGYPNYATTQNPYSDTYRGPSPFSERETIAIKNLAEANNFVFSISYHSYSDRFLPCCLVHGTGHLSSKEKKI